MAIRPPVATSAQRPSTSPFSPLSMDPLQIVMQHCDAHSLLALARCSRSTLEAASYSFAWIHAPHVVADITHVDRGDPPLRRLWNRFRRVIGRPNDLPELLPPPADANSTRPPALHAVGRVRWSSTTSAIGDWARLRTAYRVLPTLPRLVAIDLGDWHFWFVPWSRIEPLVLSLRGLTALDSGECLLAETQVRALVAHLPQLRTLRCALVSTAFECLQPLTRLPLLTDLRVTVSYLWGTAEEFAVLGNCPRLRGLSLIDIGDDEAGLLLQAARLQTLEELTLRDYTFHPVNQFQSDWAAIGANLQSLRRLTLEPVDSGLSAAILAAVVAGGFPSLAHLRVASNAISAIRMDPYVILTYRRPFLSDEGLGQSIRELFRHRPDIRVELRVRFAHAAVSASWMLPAPPRDFLSAVPQWTDFEVLRYRDHLVLLPSLFADDGLGRQVPLDDD